MVDSANERIADLKKAAAEAGAAAEEARLVAEEAEEELQALQAGDADKQESLRWGSGRKGGKGGVWRPILAAGMSPPCAGTDAAVALRPAP